MPSVRDVAREAGVSISTVSRVINGHTSVDPRLRQQVLAAVDRCHYSPAVGRRRQDSIALVYVGPFTPGSPYDSACIEGMVDAMRGSDFDLAVIDLRRDKAREETFRQFFARKGICGAILRCTVAERDVVAQIASEDVPAVVLGDHFPLDDMPFVYADSSTASREAIEHLLALGHERIAFAACEREDGDHGDRFEAYRSALAERGFLQPSLIWRIPPHRLDGAQLVRNLMGKPDRPTAVFIADPLVAVGAINEAHKMGVKIPDELSIIGFDDTDMRGLVYPNMTAVCQDSQQMGRAAFERVAALVGDATKNGAPANPRFAAWFEINETTAPPPEEASHVLPNRTRLPASRGKRSL
jgi:DNA-binding LacI/PurR family transcriptional regulator